MNLHPAENVEKMRGGNATVRTRTDCRGCKMIAAEIDGWRATGESGVLTCSALKRAYRNIIIGDRLT